MKRFVSAIGVSAALVLSGCTAYETATSEAGSFRQAKGFGDATTENFLVQAAYLSGDRLIQQMQAKFAREVDDTVNFAFNRAHIDHQARAILHKQAHWLLRNPDVRLRVFGHTDLVGSDRYNTRLGLRRARAVVRYLVRHGVARNRLDAVVSKGETEPLIAVQAPERQNRRAVTMVAGFTHGFIGDGLDGKRALKVYTDYVTNATEAPAVESVTQ